MQHIKLRVAVLMSNSVVFSAKKITGDKDRAQ